MNFWQSIMFWVARPIGNIIGNLAILLGFVVFFTAVIFIWRSWDRFQRWRKN